MQGTDARTKTTTNGGTLLRSSSGLPQLDTEVENLKKKKARTAVDGILQSEWLQRITDSLEEGFRGSTSERERELRWREEFQLTNGIKKEEILIEGRVASSALPMNKTLITATRGSLLNLNLNLHDKNPRSTLDSQE